MALVRSHDRELRIYDGSNPRNYVIGRFIGEGTDVPTMGTRPPQRLYLDRGLANKFAAYISESDEAIFSPVAMTITYLLNEDLYPFADALGNPNNIAPWQIWQKKFTPVRDLGFRINSRGEHIRMPLPDDYMLRRFLVEIQVGFMPPPGGGAAVIQRLVGVALMNRRITTEPPAIRVTNDVMVFGQMSAQAKFGKGRECHP